MKTSEPILQCLRRALSTADDTLTTNCAVIVQVRGRCARPRAHRTALSRRCAPRRRALPPLARSPRSLDDEGEAAYRKLAFVDGDDDDAGNDAGNGAGGGGGGGEGACPLAGARRGLALVMWRGRSSMTLMMQKTAARLSLSWL